MKRRLMVLAALLLVSLTAACGTTQPPEPPAPPVQEEIEPVPEPTAEELAAQEVQEILDSLTMEEKVGQLFFVRCPAENAPADIGTYHLGGYVLFGRDFADKTADDVIQTLRRYQNTAAEDSGIPLLIGVDEEGGSVVRVSANPHLRGSKYQSPQALYAKGGMEAVVSDAQEKSALLRALGINVNLAPVADVSTDPDDFIYDRTLGQDAHTAAGCVADVVTAMRETGIGSVLKHFPGYGNNVDTHTGIAVDKRPLATFEASDFLPFSAGIQAGGATTAVLVSHNIMTAVDETLPASLSPAVHRLLREDLGFDGVAMTDDLAMDAVAAYAGDGAAAVMALEAGNDLIITTDYPAQIPRVLEAVNSGALAEETVETACRRVLTWKQALGLLPPIEKESGAAGAP
jgi:beta-N-acetylhexosaminidase